MYIFDSILVLLRSRREASTVESITFDGEFQRCTRNDGHVGSYSACQQGLERSHRIPPQRRGGENLQILTGFFLFLSIIIFDS